MHSLLLLSLLLSWAAGGDVVDFPVDGGGEEDLSSAEVLRESSENWPGSAENGVASAEGAGSGTTAQAPLPRGLGPASAGCRCVPAAQCSPGAGIDIRIVNTGSTCPSGSVLCCFSQPPPPPPPPPPVCGQRTVMDVPGAGLSAGQARFGEFPWQALLLTAQGRRYIGSGVLVSNRHVVTAAHVVGGAGGGALLVRLGEWDAGSGAEPLPTQERAVASVALHPCFDAATLQCDIAVIRLARPVSPAASGPHIRTACLPAPPPAPSPAPATRCWVSGWGKDAWGPKGQWQARQRAVDVPVVAGPECEARLRQTRLGPAFRLDAAAFVCAGGEPGKDACTGDGGAPLVCEAAGGRWTVVGLVSWGIGCGDAGVPGVYTHVASYVPWLLQNLD